MMYQQSVRRRLDRHADHNHPDIRVHEVTFETDVRIRRPERFVIYCPVCGDRV